MSQFRSSRVTRIVLPTIAVLAVSGTLLATPASAAVDNGGITATYSHEGVGLKDVVPDASNKYWPAGDHYLKLADGTELEVFCIDFSNTKVDTTGDYQANSWPAAGLSATQLSQITDIVTRHDQIGTPETKTGWEEAATQVAVWSISNNVDYQKIPNTEFRDRVAAIVAGSHASTAPAPVLSYAIDGKKSVTGTGSKTKDSVDAIVTSSTGTPVADKDVVFSVDGEKTTVKTDTTGKAHLEIAPSTDPRTVSVNFTAAVSAGTVFTPVSGEQPMVAATGFNVSDQASVAVTPTTITETPTKPKPAPKPAPNPKPKPAPKASPSPTKDPIPNEFPDTGAYPLVSGLLGAGALTGLGLWGRRKFKAKR